METKEWAWRDLPKFAKKYSGTKTGKSLPENTRLPDEIQHRQLEYPCRARNRLQQNDIHFTFKNGQEINA